MRGGFFAGQVDAALHTQISVNTDAVFISFQHTGDEAADVTFNLRDFRVMLAWCMAMDMDMAIRFQSPGAPLLVEPHCAHGVSILTLCLPLQASGLHVESLSLPRNKGSHVRVINKHTAVC